LSYIPDGIRVPTHEDYWGRDGAWGWTKVAARAGRENRGRRKKERREEEERGYCYIKHKGASPVGTLLVLQGVREAGALLGDPGRSTRMPRLMAPLKCIRVPSILPHQGGLGR
jgi:hypothetical protein